MSESGDSSDTNSDFDPSCFNYENCIVRNHENSNSLSPESSWFSSHLDHDDPQTSQQSAENTCDNLAGPVSATMSVKSDFDSVEVTCEQVKDFGLNYAETFIFLLGMLNKIESYLSKLEDDSHKEWIKSQVGIVKTVFLNNCNLFKINEVQNIDGTFYIREKPNLVKNQKGKKRIKNHKSKAAKTKTKMVISEERKILDQEERKIESLGLNEEHSVCPISRQNEPEENRCIDNMNDPIEIKTAPQSPIDSSSITPPRRSTRLLHQLDGKERVFCDRLTCMSLRLPSFTSTPQYQELEQKNNENQTLNIRSGVKSNKKYKEEEQKESKKRKAKSLCHEPSKRAKGVRSAKNATCIPTSVNSPQVRSQKKKISDKVDKKTSLVSSQMSETNETMSTSAASTSGKRKLYIEEDWLHSLPSHLTF